MTGYDDLTPSQRLVLEVLAARYRLGEQIWTFSNNVTVDRALVNLYELGLVQPMSGIVERSVRAGLTDAGRAMMLSSTYKPPADAFRAAERAALDDAADALAIEHQDIGLPHEYVLRVQRWLRERD